MNSDASYCKTVFLFDFQQKPDSLNWRNMIDLNEIPILFSHGKLVDASQLINRALSLYPTYAFVHTWHYLVLEKQGRINDARSALIHGIEISNEKYRLCGYLGIFELDYGSIPEAVKWWIRSAILQFPLDRYSIDTSFLYLAYVASFLGDSKSREYLKDISDLNGRRDLDVIACNKIKQALTINKRKEILIAIQELITKIDDLLPQWMHKSGIQ